MANLVQAPVTGPLTALQLKSYKHAEIRGVRESGWAVLRHIQVHDYMGHKLQAQAQSMTTLSSNMKWKETSLPLPYWSHLKGQVGSQ